MKPDDACNMVALADRMNRLELEVHQLQTSAVQQADTLLAHDVFSSHETAVKYVHQETDVKSVDQETAVKSVATPPRADNSDHHSNTNTGTDQSYADVLRESNRATDDGFSLTREEQRRLKRRERLSCPPIGHIYKDSSDDAENDENSQRKDKHVPRAATERKTDFDDPSNANAKVILMCDSVARHVKPALFFGARYAKIVKSAWASTSTKVMEKWRSSENVEYFIMHLGIRDVRDDRSIGDIIDETKTCMETAAQKYKNARILYSEILYTTDDMQNDSIQEINVCIKTLCDNNERFIYVPHKLIQETNSMYVDETHLNDGRGTRTFVKDIVSAAYRNTRQHDTRRPRSVDGTTTGTTRHASPDNTPGSGRSETWRTAKGTVSVDRQGNRNFDNSSGTKDLIKLFVSLLDRV